VTVQAGTGDPEVTRILLAIDAREIGHLVGAADAVPSRRPWIRAKRACPSSRAAQFIGVLILVWAWGAIAPEAPRIAPG
jgi:hypothetical protein